MRDVTRVIRTTTDDEENERVQGTAHVTVTSRANGKSVSGDTNGDGIVNLDIKELAEDPDHVGTDKLKEWNFNATIQVNCDGYRTFETALVRVSGGFGLIVPMHPTDFDGPYPHRVSFDEWDALYTKNEFLLAAGNAGDHTIQVVMHNVTSTDPATSGTLGRPRKLVTARRTLLGRLRTPVHDLLSIVARRGRRAMGAHGGVGGCGREIVTTQRDANRAILV